MIKLSQLTVSHFSSTAATLGIILSKDRRGNYNSMLQNSDIITNKLFTERKQSTRYIHTRKRNNWI